MFGDKRIRMDKGLYAKAQRRAGELGYSGVDEFVVHLVERELDACAPDSDVVSGRLKGLGYIE